MSCKSNGFHRRSKFEEIEIPVPWGHISGKWWGSRNVQPVLAIHGWQDNAGTFDTLAPHLVKLGHSIFSIDLPGHGRSSHFAKGHFYYVFWDGIHIVRRIVKYFNWSNIVILGHSLGGSIAFLYAASYPTEIKSYISLDTASPNVKNALATADIVAENVDRFFDFETITDEKLPSYRYDEMVDIAFEAYNGGITREGCEIMMKRGMRKLDTGKYLFNRDPRLKVAALGLLTPEQVLEFATRITCDVMNIRGNPGMKFEFPDYYDKFLDAFNYPEFYDIVLDAIEVHANRLERHVVEGTHHLHLNNPERIVDIIDRFLKS